MVNCWWLEQKDSWLSNCKFFFGALCLVVFFVFVFFVFYNFHFHLLFSFIVLLFISFFLLFLFLVYFTWRQKSFFLTRNENYILFFFLLIIFFWNFVLAASLPWISIIHSFQNNGWQVGLRLNDVFVFFII
jgi:hypothetical protein